MSVNSSSPNEGGSNVCIFKVFSFPQEFWLGFFAPEVKGSFLVHSLYFIAERVLPPNLDHC